MEPLTNDGIDGELQRLLTIEQSPDFIARVRTAIAREPARSASYGLFLPVAAAALALTCIFGALLYFSEPAPPPMVARRPPLAAGADIQLAPDLPPETRPATSVVRVGRHRAPATVPDPALDVMISPDDREAFQRLMRSVSDEPLVLSFEETPAGFASNELTIPPITTEPLTVPEQQGAFQ